MVLVAFKLKIHQDHLKSSPAYPFLSFCSVLCLGIIRGVLSFSKGLEVGKYIGTNRASYEIWRESTEIHLQTLQYEYRVFALVWFSLVFVLVQF